MLRGIAQVFFLNNPWSGALLLIAMGLIHPWIAAVVFLGSALQSLGGWALNSRQAVREGTMGYNGALVGAAAAAALGAPGPAVLMTVVGALACIPVHEIVRTLFASRALGWAHLPVSTAPFCIVAGLLFDLLWPLVQPGTPTSREDLFEGIMLGLFNNFSEVVLSDGILPGLLIVIALFVGGMRIGVFGLVGSLTALAGAFLVHESVIQVSSGMLGYSAVLVSIALGAVVWQGKPLWMRAGGAIGGVVLTMLLQPVLSLTPVPLYTWPFLLSLWTNMLAVAAVERLRRGNTGVVSARSGPEYQPS
ncbi:urea transporter [Kocuria sp. cx-455]|nr:urea transporter [Kocuria sp. cx-455]